MRSKRLSLIFLAFYLTFIGGSAYYVLVFPLRIFHHVFITILIASWLFRRIRSGNGIPKTPLNYPIYASITVWLLTSITSLDPRIALENTWFLIIHVIMFFAIADLLQRGRHKLIFEAQFMMATVVVFMSGIELASWYLGLGIIPNTDIGWINVIDSGFIIPRQLPRLSLAMNISTLLAGYVAPLITICIGWALSVRRKDYRQVLLVLASLLAIILILTFSRGGLLSVMTAIGTLIMMRVAQLPNLTERGLSRYLLAGTTVAGIIIVTGFMVYTLSSSRGSGDEGRLDMYRSAIEITVDYPVTGVGPSQFGRAFRDYRTPELARDKLASAHNYYLNTLAETGLLGFLVNLWLGYALLRRWLQLWQQAESSKRKLRLEATYAAILGVGIHSLVDVFTTTPVVLMLFVLISYSVIGQRDILTPPPKGARLPAIALFILIIGYGIWFIQLDRAQLDYQFSLITEGDEAFERAQSAQEIDPYLNLYDLNIAYLMGRDVLENPNSTIRLQDAISEYERVLELEPTWNIGWLNLAQLTILDGDEETAFTYIQRAQQINPLTVSSLIRASYQDRLELTTEDEITENYVYGINRLQSERSYFPTSPYWTETETRINAVETFLIGTRIEQQYRTLAIYDPDRLASILPVTPTTAPEWWVLGEYALSIENNPQQAIEYFDEAISLAATNGDYYVSRARANLQIDREQAQDDLEVAYLFGTTYENLNFIMAQLTTDDIEINQLLSNAIPVQFESPEFSTVLYSGRFSNFETPYELRYPGPGRELMEPLYLLAQRYLEAGNTTEARRIYKRILDYAPDEQEARNQLLELLNP